MINIKDLYDLFNKAGKIDEYQKILQLIDDSFKSRDTIEILNKEIKELREKLVIRDNLEFRNNAYYKKSDGDGPFCQSCWDEKNKLVRILSLNDIYYQCKVCKNDFNIKGGNIRPSVHVHRPQNPGR